jgi:hypothetical protein
MDEAVLERAMRRVTEARTGGLESARLDAALERSRAEVESLARAAARLEESLPEQVGLAVREGLAREVATVGRNLAEIRGLMNQALRRLERLEQEILTERNARLDDLGVLVDLISSGWQGIDTRLQHLEEMSAGGQVVALRAEPEAPGVALAARA